MPTPQIPVALFIRVSDGHRQDYNRQLHELQKEVAAENYHVVATIAEQGSGSKRMLAARPAISELLALAKSRQIKKVLVTEFSRLGRRGREVRSVIEDLMEAGVSTWSGRLRMETLLPDGTKNPIAVLMMFIYTERDEEEATLLSFRSKSGIAHKRETKPDYQHGRPIGKIKEEKKLLSDHADVVKKLHEGQSVRNTATLTKKSTATVRKVRKVLVEAGKLAVDETPPAT